MPRPAVFLDRDDTLIACRSITPGGDLGDPALVQLLPGVAEGCRRLKEAGFLLVVVSNQGGVARGSYTEADVHAVNAELNRQLHGDIDAFYFCPYHPQGAIPKYTREHPWRKPQPGMLLQAAADLGIDLANSWMVGDQPRDLEAGRAAGCLQMLIQPEYPDPMPKGEYAVARDFTEAASYLLLTQSLADPRTRRVIKKHFAKHAPSRDDAPREGSP